MGRSRGESEEGFGSDSFLDVIANIIGILIILVVVAGLRAQNNTNEETPEVKQAAAALAAAQQTESNLQGELHGLTAQIQNVTLNAAARFQERAVVAAAVADRKQALDRQRAALATGSREHFDLQREVAAAQASLNKLAQDKAAADAYKGARVEVKAYPGTPISQTVIGKEIHFQLLDGRVAPLPMEDLLERFKSKAQAQVYRLRQEKEFSDTVGPVDGFRLRYSLERIDVNDDPSHAGSYVDVQLTFVPMSRDLGETGAEAVGPQSQFRTALEGLDQRRTTVTLWTYPDSFSLFRELREELHRLGYSVAGRPLPHGHPISASPHGSKSSAQ